jgi:hypothetical protein
MMGLAALAFSGSASQAATAGAPVTTQQTVDKDGLVQKTHHYRHRSHWRWGSHYHGRHRSHWRWGSHYHGRHRSHWRWGSRRW